MVLSVPWDEQFEPAHGPFARTGQQRRRTYELKGSTPGIGEIHVGLTNPRSGYPHL